MVDISVIVPGVRPDRFKKLYASLHNSTKRSFELIVCGPYYPPKEMEEIRNFKFVSDYGSPVRASNIAAELATGEYITWAADDAVFTEGSLDEFITSFKSSGVHVLTCKYLEGKDEVIKKRQPDSYFMMNGSHWTACSMFPNDYPLFNVGIMKRSTFEDLGGWDCSYEGTFYSHADMAARAFMRGKDVGFCPGIFLLDCDHSQDDHKPIEDAQTNYDMPMFKGKYGDTTSSLHPPSIPALKEWRDSPPVWKRRFG